MSDSTPSVKKVASAPTGGTTENFGESGGEAADPGFAETSTAPLPGGGDEPTKLEVSAESVSADELKDDLKEAARSRGLDDSGTKQELADRVNEHDEKNMHRPEVLYPHKKD